MPPAVNTALVSTPQIPLMTGNRAKMLQTLDQNKSLYSLSLHFEGIVEELEKLAKKPARTIIDFKIDSAANKWRMIHLLHAIPRDLLRSIICGTLAYDSTNARVEEYSKNGPGIYVIGICINRNTVNRTIPNAPAGSFLKWDEIAVLITHLEGYIEAYEIYQSKRLRSQDDRELVRIAIAIDRTYKRSLNLSGHERTLYIENDGQAENVKALIRGFKERMPASTATRDRETAQHQSPLYVGCSDHVDSRLTRYNLSTDLSGINKLLALTVSVINFMGLSPKLVRKVALRTWEPDQLAAAEKLVIALARSSCHMDRFNVAEGGGKQSTNDLAVLERGKEEVMQEGHYCKSMKASLEDMNERVAFLENRAEINHSIPALQDMIKVMNLKRDQRTAIIGLNTLARMERTVVELQQERERIDRHNALLTRMLELIHLVRNVQRGEVQE
ncbi:hypothetical protein N0V92_011231 [Colletotrichum tropicale]|nr:hypothetical protein N0V92_011231 [Colletotrichum tropicale]